ncbi:hypothetical protein LTSERUB_3115 [Salmonella enterica subsp. enterica serovar Rubislaw str. A4-653]|uniref:Uncharacterized protein n=1 Tax=Salmonella enterica subsp. enterica serovar Rubislaw str. A4-653 TaxID=913081 RepID=G5QKB7_SALRU|nr:hypothetical protein LTSERUB_3115 [Salmonella enterica subsp. enterica serovar Rubislaw str. A4-653]
MTSNARVRRVKVSSLPGSVFSAYAAYAEKSSLSVRLRGEILTKLYHACTLRLLHHRHACDAKGIEYRARRDYLAMTLQVSRDYLAMTLRPR